MCNKHQNQLPHFCVWGTWDYCTYPDIFTVSCSGGKMRQGLAGKALHEHYAIKLKEFLFVFAFVTERLCYQLDEPVIIY